MIVQSSQWHREDFALPEDVSLVSLIKLRRVTAQHVDTFDIYLSTAEGSDVSGERRLAGLEFFRKSEYSTRGSA